MPGFLQRGKSFAKHSMLGKIFFRLADARRFHSTELLLNPRVSFNQEGAASLSSKAGNTLNLHDVLFLRVSLLVQFNCSPSSGARSARLQGHTMLVSSILLPFRVELRISRCLGTKKCAQK